MACRHSSSQQEALYTGMIILWTGKTDKKILDVYILFTLQTRNTAVWFSTQVEND